jgi:hypothetical protein
MGEASQRRRHLYATKDQRMRDVLENFLYPLWVGPQKTVLSHHRACTSLFLEPHAFLVLQCGGPREGMPVASLVLRQPEGQIF